MGSNPPMLHSTPKTCMHFIGHDWKGKKKKKKLKKKSRLQNTLLKNLKEFS
jgi:hypothetical protein